MMADVAQRERAEGNIAQRMDHDIAIRMRDKATIVRNVHATEHDVIAGTECVDVDALADAHGWEPGFGIRDSGLDIWELTTVSWLRKPRANQASCRRR